MADDNLNVSDMTNKITHAGSCHCGAVRFEVKAPAAEITATRCNCSICTKTGFLHLIVGKSAFRLLAGADVLTTYRFNTGIAAHTFCSICGVKAFYTPRSHPDGVSVNVNCLDPDPDRRVRIVEFDGHNWQRAIAGLRARDDVSQ